MLAGRRVASSTSFTASTAWPAISAAMLSACFGSRRHETDSGVYDLHLAEDGAASCECKGYLQWHKCKHVDACRMLVALGRI
jgi:hypothetical protein